MQLRRLLVIAGTYAACVGPGIAAAQDEGGFMLEEAPEEEPKPVYSSQVEIGAGWNTEDSFKFGEYTGLEEDGPFAIGNFDVLLQSDWQSEDPEYFRGHGRRLGLESREVELEYGRQGKYAIGLGYDQIPHFLFDDARTPYRGVGGTNLTLPGAFVPARTTAGFGNLDTTAQKIEIENDRKKLRGFLSFLPSDKWYIDVDVHREWREGTDQTFGIFGTSGGNPASVALPEPIDYVTDEVEGTVGYSGDRFQAEFTYEGSFFNEQNRALVWQSAYTNDPGEWDPIVGARSPGRLSLPPDNQSHHFIGSAGYTLGRATRVSGSLSYGWLHQDEDLLPFTVNPGLSVTTPLPRDSAEAEINSWTADLAFSTRPTLRSDVRAHYRFVRRDNDTPRDVFVRLKNDTEDQPAQPTDQARINLPHSFEKQQVDLEAGYRIVPRAKVSAKYEFELLSRTFAEVNEQREHTGTIKLRGRPIDRTNGWIKYSHGERDGNDYSTNAPFIFSHTSAFLAGTQPIPDPISQTPFGGADRFENHPQLVKFNMADRSLDEIKAALSITPTPEIQVAVSGSYRKEDFDNVILGLRDRQRWHGSLDLAYAPQPNITTYAFYSFEQIEDEIRGHQFNFLPGTFFSLLDPAQRWTRDREDRIHTIGAGATWTPLDDKLDLSVDYTLSLANTEQDFSGGADLQPVTNAPDLESILQSLQFTADYHIMEGTRLRFSYLFEDFDADDFALDGVGLTPAGDLLTFGQSSPSYTAHVFGLSMVVNF